MNCIVCAKEGGFVVAAAKRIIYISKAMGNHLHTIGLLSGIVLRLERRTLMEFSANIRITICVFYGGDKTFVHPRLVVFS